MPLPGSRLWPCPVSFPFLSRRQSGLFPRPALLSVFGRVGLSVALPARPAPRRFAFDACTSPTGLPGLLRPPSSLHAGTTTPGANDSVHISPFSPICRRHSSVLRRVGSRTVLFEACTVLTSVPACMVAELVNTVLCHRGASVHAVPPTAVPLGCYQPTAIIVGWDSHPLRTRGSPRLTERSKLAAIRVAWGSHPASPRSRNLLISSGIQPICSSPPTVGQDPPLLTQPLRAFANLR